MGKPADRNARIMREEFGTAQLITDYGVMEKAREGISRYKEALEQLRDPSSIRNAEDYDDWEYGTEPIPHDHTWTRKRST
jgi:hypothetical protein